MGTTKKHERQHRKRHEQRPSVRIARSDDHDEGDGREQQCGPHRDRGQRADEGDAGAAAVAAAEVRTDPRCVAHPQPVVGERQAGVAGDERPGVVGVHRDVRIPCRGPSDLLEEPGAHERRLRGELHHRQAERGRQDDRRDQPGNGRGQDPDRTARLALPGQEPPEQARSRLDGIRRRIVAVPAGRPQRPADRDDGDERDEDAELRLDDRRDHREDRGSLRVIAPQLAQAEQQEHHAERVDLAPHGAVEPADRVEDEEQGREERHGLARSELAGHRPGEIADRRIGQDRRELDQVADATQPRCDRADEPQDVHVARGVVDESALVERSRTLGRQAARPPLERDDVGPEA